METLIVLIPKIDNPTFMKDFGPISLCNVVYKIITKVLTNRLRPFLPDIVSPLQGGFIPGRGAPDNIIVAQEILNFMKHTKSKKGTLAFKIDLEKAYDRVDWRFLESTLIAFGFPIITVNLIMTCVRASSLSIMWNGNRLDSFAPRRGFRQGDPMSPYLFVLCMERLACYISHKVVEGVWKPISVTRGGPKFSHLMFADDLLLFCQATKSQIQMVMHSLNIFCKASGMKVNLEKSKAFYSKNVTARRRDIFTSVFSIRFALDLGRYLGVNLNHSRTSRASFHSVIEKISFFPNWVCDKLSSMMRQFLWKGQVDGRGLSLVNWRTDKPWVALLRAKYLRNEGVLDGPVPCNASHVWKSISKAFGALKDAFSWCVGSLDQSFWFDNWSIESPIAQDVPFVHISDSDLTIRNVWKDGQWNLRDIFSIIPEDVKQRLNAYNPDLNAGESSGWSWDVASSRLYSARSGYSWLAKRKFDWNEHDNWLWVWRLHIPEKYKFLIWLSLHNAIPTAEFRLGRGLALSSTCHRCQNSSESILHCLRECPSAKEVWTLLGLYSDNSNLHDWLYRGARSGDVFLFFSTIWWIWRSRNNDLFNIDDSWSASKVVSLIRSSVREFHTIFAMHQSLSSPSLCLHWVPPPVHSVKLNCDASWFAPSGYAGFGCIIRNPDGCWLKGCTGKVEVCSVFFAELYAIWRGLLLAWESEFREVICETGCLEALFLVNQRMLSKDIPEWDLAKHIQEVMNWNWRVSILLIQRTANSIADCMAKAAASVADIHSNRSQPWNYRLCSCTAVIFVVKENNQFFFVVVYPNGIVRHGNEEVIFESDKTVMLRTYRVDNLDALKTVIRSNTGGARTKEVGRVVDRFLNALLIGEFSNRLFWIDGDQHVKVMFDVHVWLMHQHVMELYAAVCDVIVGGGPSPSSPEVVPLEATPIHYVQPHDNADEDDSTYVAGSRSLSDAVSKDEYIPETPNGGVGFCCFPLWLFFDCWMFLTIIRY
ncbi:uncharacterized protein LOC130967155 [Arachis stenosperma]|uniref:uncharacterized protein LOC130967155 n=1 Tax=Arachis stenosperma TaxID=217475 RepID=UPI0025AD8392|nr:uncharacterized protein LOC130967155 [Arachis stenosperma]